MNPSCLSIARPTKSQNLLMSPMRKLRARLDLMRSNTNNFNPSKKLPTIKTPEAHTAPIVNSHSRSSKPKLMMNHNPICSNLAFQLTRRTGIDKKTSISKNLMRSLLRVMNKVIIINWLTQIFQWTLRSSPQEISIPNRTKGMHKFLWIFKNNNKEVTILATPIISKKSIKTIIKSKKNNKAINQLRCRLLWKLSSIQCKLLFLLEKSNLLLIHRIEP